jgi:Coenzyme PQQ synthesis protein D (PqqD)
LTVPRLTDGRESAEYAGVAVGRPSREDVLSARPSLPQHVVYREFVNETVVLNLETGTYHGLNPSGGRMLETLGASATVRDAAASLASDYGLPTSELEQDLYEFCVRLHERGLVDLAHE